MGKIKNDELAKFISARIKEIMYVCGLSIAELALYTDLSVTSIRHSLNMKLITSAETILRICRPFSITLADFFDQETPIIIDTKARAELTKFKAKHQKSEQVPSYKRQTSDVLKQQRDFMVWIIHSSDYFAKPKTIEQMVTDFAKDYNMVFTASRIYALLRKHLAEHALGKKLLPRKSIQGKISERPYEYFKFTK
ncbi:hypothetical protein AAW12_24365 [Sphingobacterium sp. Ag1]|uniref:helix-turn-helix domain-containing protein n=1 Tax=Sphingobacterium sp. Ag1 TaxID=1643451 RepID=UPI000627976A|nr:helix-turn-helix transcriptional regulator [Sphingobacterium sp. Ag1]KKO89244.1 hypothetical protein AAW12_24365 [Sphingobacterium sp. Ag1]